MWNRKEFRMTPKNPGMEFYANHIHFRSRGKGLGAGLEERYKEPIEL